MRAKIFDHLTQQEDGPERDFLVGIAKEMRASRWWRTVEPYDPDTQAPKPVSGEIIEEI